MSILDSIQRQIPPIHKEGYPFIGGFALASLILFWLWSPLGWIGTILTVWCALFFRDPVRVTPVREGLVVSPADGRVSMITMALPPAELGLGGKGIVCFVREGQAIGAGERFGLIRFGSRLDVYLPVGTKALVSEGQTAIAGETILADLAGDDPSRAYRAN